VPAIDGGGVHVDLKPIVAGLDWGPHTVELEGYIDISGPGYAVELAFSDGAADVLTVACPIVGPVKFEMALTREETALLTRTVYRYSVNITDPADRKTQVMKGPVLTEKAVPNG
jgi:hypothetical protein